MMTEFPKLRLGGEFLQRSVSILQSSEKVKDWKDLVLMLEGYLGKLTKEAPNWVSDEDFSREGKKVKY